MAPCVTHRSSLDPSETGAAEKGGSNVGEGGGGGSECNNLFGHDCRFQARRADRMPFQRANPIRRPAVRSGGWIINKRLLRPGYLRVGLSSVLESHP